ncbi:MAG: anti-sigma factor [Cypionkella sp.]
MTSTSETDFSDLDLMAAEYVVGTLDLEGRSAAEALIKRDPTFAARVQDWENRLADLNDDYEPVPAPNLLPAIEARLFPKPAKSSRGWLAALIGFGATTAAAVIVVAFLAISSTKPTLTADLSADASSLRYSAAFSGSDLTLTRLEGSAAETGKDYELWLIEGDKAPVSLGVIDASFTISLPKVEAGYVLAITLEPKGGAPEGKPTGQILAAGPLKSS